MFCRSWTRRPPRSRSPPKRNRRRTKTRPTRTSPTAASEGRDHGGLCDGRTSISRSRHRPNVPGLAFKLNKPGEVAGDLVRLQDGYAIVVLKEKKAATREDFDKDRDGFVARYQYKKEQRTWLAEYIARLRKQAQAEIKVNEYYAKDPEKEQAGDDYPDRTLHASHCVGISP